ncbi:T7SS effector LXG polymorphic toxin [Bacillus pumilus]|nr:T7SS effector LXG polymorphic toxin [Bacillus pumilus]MED4631010.1 T7SS effector LXG polymorphic toxin [Bacillus pumilus]MED4672508.1 T7SS effector LXG polymorphic toxin [Bacillus pumilus]MED4723049.1 T7SS effector LXG polymorphic toxin [Bacillus pumilus]MED4743548.1 T7SS effector LXG polymorphic toxin [Bacillus pumilus]
MGKILDAKALTSAMDARAKHYQELREQMVDLKKALQGVANLGDDFTGKGADNIKSFYKELAGNVDMFISFIDKQKAFHEGVSGTLDDTSFGGKTFVEEHFLDNAVHMGIKNAKSIVKDQKKALKTIFQDIDNLISLEVFDSQTFDEKIADAEDERKKTVKDLRELDQNVKDEYALSETEQQATMALYTEMMNATNDGKAISPMNFDKKAYQNSEIYKAKSDIEKQTSEYLKIKKEQEEAREIAKEQEALANRPWYEKALDYGGNIVNELTGVNDAKRAATGVDPITGEELTAGQRVAAGGMAAAGYIPIVGWAGRIFKGGKAVYKTTQATSAAVRAVDIYKTSQKSFDALKTSQKGLYGLTATNGFSEAITGRDMFGNKISKEQQEASMNAALGILLPFSKKSINGSLRIGEQKVAEKIIAERTKGLDLRKHPIQRKQLSTKKMKELKDKFENRTITKLEYENYKWNKKFAKHRNTGVNEFWYQERQRILNKEDPTRNWDKQQLNDILNGKKPKVDGKTVQGHHSYSASQYPHLANKGEIIYPATPNEHFNGWHGGNWKNSLPGERIKPIDDF